MMTLLTLEVIAVVVLDIAILAQAGFGRVSLEVRQAYDPEGRIGGPQAS